MASTSTSIAAKNTAVDNDYFTATIVGLPTEVVLGKAFTERKTSSGKTITVQAMTAQTWLSDPARQLLKKHVKKPLKTIGLPFPAANFSKLPSKGANIRAFILGFVMCAALSAAYITQPWLQQLLRYK